MDNMVSLDMRTIIFSFVLINIVSTLVVLFLWIQYRDRYKGIVFLVYAFLCQLIAFLLIIARDAIPAWISIEIANGISVIGIYLGLRGLELYTGRKSSQIPNIVLLFFFAAVHAWFNYVKPDLTIRYLIISVAAFTFFAQCAWLMLVRAPQSMLKLTRYTGIVFISFCVLCGIKILEFLVWGNKPVDYFQSGLFEAFVMIGYQMLIIFLSFSLSLMYNNHLLADIRTEEEKFLTTFHTAPNGFILSSFPDGRIIEVNSGFFEITGYESSEIAGKTISELSIWENEKDQEDVIKELSVSGLVNKKEFPFRKKSGEIISGLFFSRVISVANEKRMISSIYDVTERRNFQELISHERNLLRTLIDNLPDPVTIKDFEGRYLLNNKAHLQIIGAETQEEVLGKTAFDYFPEEFAENYAEDEKNVMRTGKMILDKVECAEHSETGFPYWHLTSKIPIRDNTGKPIQILTISHDITERKRAEDALKESDEFNRSLLKTIPFGMDIVDEQGIILFQSEDFRKIFGSDAIGSKCWEVYRDDKLQCQDCPLLKGIKTGVTEIYESHGVQGGKIFEIYHTGMMFHGKKAMLEIFHDVTERKKAEADLIKSKEIAEESDRLKTAFLHNISHEIRTPMNAIVGFANLLQEPGLSSEEYLSFTEIISRSSRHLLSIVNDVIEISNVEAGRLKFSMNEINLNNLLLDLLQQFKPEAAAKEIELRIEAPDSDSLKNFRTDNTKLIQVLSNLINNSLKFTKSGTIIFGFIRKDKFLEFFVSDTGIGIDKDQQLKIFDRFYQVDNTVSRLHEGTGIGLSISKAYVELLGGKIWLESEIGKGTVIYFTLPFLPEP